MNFRGANLADFIMTSSFFPVSGVTDFLVAGSNTWGLPAENSKNSYANFLFLISSVSTR